MFIYKNSLNDVLDSLNIFTNDYFNFWLKFLILFDFEIDDILISIF